MMARGKSKGEHRDKMTRKGIALMNGQPFAVMDLLTALKDAKYKNIPSRREIAMSLKKMDNVIPIGNYKTNASREMFENAGLIQNGGSDATIYIEVVADEEE